MVEQRLPRRAVILVPVDAASSDRAGANTPDWPEQADENILEALRALGYEPSVVAVSLDDVARKIARLKADVVLNLCDGFGEIDGYPGLEAIDALEARGIPYTGSSHHAYWMGCDKLRMKLHFLNAGVPTPASQVFGDADEPMDPSLRFPLFVKPVSAGGSGGIDLASVVNDEAELRAKLRTTIAEYGPALVERYVEGRELTVALLGDHDGELEVLPPLEVTFGGEYPEGRKVRTYATKSDPSSPLYRDFQIHCPAPLEQAELEAVLDAARRAYVAIGCTGYGRVDIRLGAEGPMVLEVNPNCSLEWIEGNPFDSGLFPLSAQAAGYSLPEMYRRLIEIAQSRPQSAKSNARSGSRRRKRAARR